MSATELREQTVRELRQRADEIRRELLGIRLEKAQTPGTNLKQWRHSRKELARVLTVIREKERTQK